MFEMITIITGEKDTGKSTFLKKWYESAPRGAGFYSRKAYRDNRFIGYDLLFLPGMRSFPFIRLTADLARYGYEPSSFPICKGRFSFSAAGFRLAGEWIEKYALPGQPVWIDEVGGLELTGGGFDESIRRALAAHRDVRMIFRKHLLQQLVKHYAIDRFRLIGF